MDCKGVTENERRRKKKAHELQSVGFGDVASRRKTTGGATAQSRDRLGLLPFGPDPVHSRPLHRPRPSFVATHPALRLSFYSRIKANASDDRPPCAGRTSVAKRLFGMIFTHGTQKTSSIK